ncbi:unnamed protein product [Urochloa humidicola]
MAAAKEVAKEVGRAANKEVAADFIEELAKEIAQKMVKEWFKRRTEGQGPEDKVGGLKVQEEDMGENILVGVLKAQEEVDIDEIISKILYGHLEPLVEGVKDEQDVQLTLSDARGGKDETELPPPWPLQDDRVQKLFKEIESLQKEWIALTLAQTTETTPPSKWSWIWFIIGGIVVIILVGGAYFWYRRCGGSGSGGGNGGGGAGEDGRRAVVLGQQDKGMRERLLLWVSRSRSRARLWVRRDSPPPQNLDQVAHPLSPVGLQILLCGSDLPSGPLACRNIVSIDGLVPAARGTCDVTAAHLVPLALPAGTATIAEALEEIIVASVVEEFTKMQTTLKEESEEASRGAFLIEKSEVAPAVSCLERSSQELIINLLSHCTEENTMVEEEFVKLCKSVHLPLVAGPVGTALCV